MTGVPGEQEEDGVDDVVRTGGPTQRDAAKDFQRQRGLAILVVRHQTQADGIDANRVRASRQCQRAHQRQQTSLTRAVSSRFGARVPTGEYGGEKDDCRITSGHQRHEVLAPQRGAADHFTERRFPIRLIGATRAIGTCEPAHGMDERTGRQPVIAEARLEAFPCRGLLERAVDPGLHGVVWHGARLIDRDDPPSLVAEAGYQGPADEAVAAANDGNRGDRF